MQDGWIGRGAEQRWGVDGWMQDGEMHGHRVDSRTKEISDAEHSVLDSLPLVSPLGFHFRKSQMLQRVGFVQSSHDWVFPLQSVRRTPERVLKGFSPFLGK